MQRSKVRVVPSVVAFGGWKGELTIDGDVLTIDSLDGSKHLAIDVKQVKRTSFNSNNGLWVFKLRDGSRIRMQSAGLLLSADRTSAGRAANDQIGELLAKHQVSGFSV
ncbi:MAG: hypothetical protein QOG10_6180 [Kribbellaceae bacterium]|jgi:hypothetical protein|nr:hypothetical protein [Kribbellaceae bacterium]